MRSSGIVRSTKSWITGKGRLGFPVLAAIGLIVALLAVTGGTEKLRRQFTVPPSAFASATVDGRVTVSDGYTEFASMSNGTDSV